MGTIIHTDVAVIGGGTAGIAAAVAAAEKGLTVILVERNSFLGGKATAAQVGTVCGLYKFSKTTTPEYIAKGFAKKFAEKLQQRSCTTPLSNPSGLHYLPYDIEAFKNICLELLTEHQVMSYFDTEVSWVEMKDDCIESISIKTGETFQRAYVKSVIDCSGEGIISRLANQPFIKSEYYQAAAQVFTLQNIDPVSENALGMILKKTLQSAIDEKKLPDHYDRVYIVQGSLRNGRVSLKVGIPLIVTNTPQNLQALKESAGDIVHNLARYLIASVAVFKNASLFDMAPEVGIRVNERPLGKYILTDEDVLTCKKTTDAIAKGAWPIEEWEQDKRVKMRYFSLDDFYHIPAGCLQSAMVKNLWMAGRSISATDAAIASARVMGICLQTGYAAGLLATANVLNISNEEVIKIIQTDQL